MSLIGLLILLVVCGFCCWLVLTYIPMPQPFKAVIVAVVVLVLVVFLLQQFGLLSGAPMRLR